MSRKIPHDCNEQYCSSCREYVPSGRHVCFMKPEKIDQEIMKQHRDAKFLFFDLECYQDEKGTFIPNVAILQDYKGTEFRFPADQSELGNDVTEEFCSFLFDERFRNHYVIAHNFRGFDSYPILRWLLNNGIKPEVIMNGGKVMQLDVKEFGIRFRDSYNYNPQSLSAWARTFDLANTEQKGTFPHCYNGPEYWNKVVEYPKRDAYDYSMKKKADRKVFMKFYRKDRRKKKNRFDVNDELFTYCSQDVTVLRVCCGKLREIFMDISGGLCPFVSALTIAGLCGFFWRGTLLEPSLIELIHPTQRTGSIKASQWLTGIRQSENLDLTEEARVSSYYVDALCTESKTVFEFYGKLHSAYIQRILFDENNAFL